MKRQRHYSEKNISQLRTAQLLLNQGQSDPGIWRFLAISAPIYQHWQQVYELAEGY